MDNLQIGLKLVKVRFLQGSILGPMFFLVYISHLPEALISATKLFANDTSLF